VLIEISFGALKEADNKEEPKGTYLAQPVQLAVPQALLILTPTNTSSLTMALQQILIYQSTKMSNKHSMHYNIHPTVTTNPQT